MLYFFKTSRSCFISLRHPGRDCISIRHPGRDNDVIVFECDLNFFDEITLWEVGNRVTKASFRIIINITFIALISSGARARKRNKTKSLIIFKSRGHRGVNAANYIQRGASHTHMNPNGNNNEITHHSLRKTGAVQPLHEVDLSRPWFTS